MAQAGVISFLIHLAYGYSLLHKMTYPWRLFELQESSTTAALSHASQQYFFSVHLILQVLSTDKTLEVGKVIISGQLTWWFFAVPSAQQWCAMGGWSQLVEAQESLLRHLFPTTPSVTGPEGLFTIQKWQMQPGLRGSVGWASSCGSKGCWLISGHGTCQRAGSMPVGKHAGSSWLMFYSHIDVSLPSSLTISF